MTERKKIKMKICLVGELAVGKTSLINRYVRNTFSDRYIQTIGAKITKKELILKNPERDVEMDVDMTIWDIMGEKGFRELLKESYFYGAQGIVAVCDVTREDTFYEIPTWLNSIEKVTGELPTEFLANKVDLKDKIVFGEEDMRNLGNSYSSPYFFTSAKSGENVFEAFADLAQRIMDRDMPI